MLNVDQAFDVAVRDPRLAAALRFDGGATVGRLGVTGEQSAAIVGASVFQRPDLGFDVLAAAAAVHAGRVVTSSKMVADGIAAARLGPLLSSLTDWTDPTTGDRVHRDADGTTTTTATDGSVTVVQPDGTWDETLRDGTRIHRNTDDSIDIVSPDGSTTHQSPDGSSEAHGADGSTTLVGADGVFVYTSRQGMTVHGVAFSDGHQMYVQPDGTAVVAYSTGPYTWSLTATLDGSATVQMVHGGWVTVRHDGTIHVQTSDGGTLDIARNGRVSAHRRFGETDGWLEGTYTQATHQPIADEPPIRTGVDGAPPILDTNGVAVHLSSRGVKIVSSPHGGSGVVFPNAVNLAVRPSGIVRVTFPGKWVIAVFGDETHFVKPDDHYAAVRAAGGYWGTGAFAPPTETAYETDWETPTPIPGSFDAVAAALSSTVQAAT